MPLSTSGISELRFGPFELHLSTGELRKSGALINLPPQPFKILALLASRTGQLVTREEIQQQIWGNGTFVDFEHGLNFAIQRVRTALGDVADTPRYIETLPRRGYRFIAPVTPVGTDAAPLHVENPQSKKARLSYRLAISGAALAAVGILLMGLKIGGWRRAKPLHIESLAVLPLENLSGDPAQDYFADGMTDELTTNLAQIRSLRVISRTSAMQYKGTKKLLPQIARELEVDAVVEGAVVRSGNQVKITAQLIHAATDRHLWAKSYERDLRDVIGLERDAAQAIATEVRAELTPEESNHLASTRTVNPEAYEAYLKGRYYSSKGTAVGINKAVEYFQQAIEKDPNYALAYAGLADAYNLLGFGVVPGLPPKEAARNAKAAATKALALDDTLSEAHAALGFTKFLYDWDWEGAEREYRRVIELSPGSPIGYHRYGLQLGLRGRFDEALANIKHAQQLDPLSPENNRFVIVSLLRAGQSDQAMEQARKMLELHPDNFHTHFGLGMAYVQERKYAEAIVELQKASDISGGNAGARSLLAHAYVALGNKTEAEKILKELKGLSNPGVLAYQIAVISADLGRKNEAFEWLEKGYEERCAAIVHLKVDPRLSALHSDPRYQDLLRRVGFPE
jgi:TolB-like protein/DNA-binding winged helix-turn-helix (wHTH) protein/Tfp pilus assembly protein PilF